MIELKVTVEDEKQAENLLQELNGREGITAKVFHFFDGEKLYVTRQYYEDYIRDMAYNFAHPEEQKNEPLRTVSNEELANCITLEELDQHLTERIHRFYHPNE